jgi:hypothetical protein
VTSHGGPGSEDGCTVVLCELVKLRVGPGIIKVRIDNPRIQVVDQEGCGIAPEESESVFPVPDEVLGRMPLGGLGVAIEVVAEDSANQMHTAPLAPYEDQRYRPEADLELLFRSAPHPFERDFGLVCKAEDEAFDRVIGLGEPVSDYQILINALGGELGTEPLAVKVPQRAALTGWPRLGPDGRVGRFSRVGSQTQVATDCLTVEVELKGDLAREPAMGGQRDDKILQANAEVVHRSGLRSRRTQRTTHLKMAGF